MVPRFARDEDDGKPDIGGFDSAGKESAGIAGLR
jgi:hypothetical protein